MDRWNDRLASEARAQRLSWAEIGRRTGLGEDRVRSYVNKKRGKNQKPIENPRGDTLERIARALNVELLWLRDGAGPRRAGEEQVDDPHTTTAEITCRSEFGVRVKGARTRRRLSLEQACAGLMISHRRWASIEAGDVSPSLIELVVISERLRESLDWLVSGYVTPIDSDSAVEVERARRTSFHEGTDTGRPEKKA